MRRLIPALALALGLFALPSIARAENTTYTPCVLTTTAPVVCFAHAGRVPQIFNNSVTSQTANVYCYDNATAASGTVVFSMAPLGPSQVVQWADPGLSFLFGLTCQADAAATGAGITVDFVPVIRGY